MKKIKKFDIDQMICYFKETNNTEMFRDSYYQLISISEKICIKIPTTFYLASDTYIKNRYFSINRPKKVWIEDLYNVNCIFYPIDKDNQELESALKDAKEEIMLGYNKVVFYDIQKIVTADIESMWFDFKSYAESEMVYNLIFFADIEGQRILGIFNCRFALYTVWREIVIYMIKSITLIQ
jgi:hypothetical protein